MSDNKKYYYLKLKEDFFNSDSMIILESMQDGYKYSNILLKLYLRSLKNEGKLMFNDRIPYNANILAQVTRHSVGDVEKAVSIFKDLGLIEVLDNGAIFVTDIQNFVGTSSTEADRKREYRNRIEKEKQLVIEGGTNVRTDVQKDKDKTPPEIDIEIDIEIEKDINIKSEGKDRIPYSKIIDYLNQNAGKSFKNVESNKKLIKARWNEGASLEDFKKVIDTKVSHAKDPKHLFDEKYLRPSTLFGTKFDNYLNETPVTEKPVLSREEESYAGIDF